MVYEPGWRRLILSCCDTLYKSRPGFFFFNVSRLVVVIPNRVTVFFKKKNSLIEIC